MKLSVHHNVHKWTPYLKKINREEIGFMRKKLFLFSIIMLSCFSISLALSINSTAILDNYYKGLNAPKETFVGTWGTMTSWGQSCQYVAVDPEGNIWVTNYGAPGRGGIYVFNSKGAQLSFSPITTGITFSGVTLNTRELGGVVYNPVDGLMYVTSRDTSALAPSRIYRYNRTTGDATTGLDTPWGNPAAIAITAGGTIYSANKLTPAFVTIDPITGYITSSTGTTGGVNRQGAVTPDGSRFFLANEASDNILVFSGSTSGGYTLATTFAYDSATDPGGVDIIDDVIAVSKTNGYKVDFYSLADYSYLGTVDTKSSMEGLGAAVFGPFKPKGLAISKDSTWLYVANFSSIGPMLAVVPLNNTSVVVDSGATGDFTSVQAAINSWCTGGTYAAGTAPFVIKVKEGSGPYDEAMCLDSATTGRGDIKGDIIIKSDSTTGTKAIFKLQKGINALDDGIYIYQENYDVTFQGIVFCPSTTGTKLTDDMVKVDENFANTTPNWISFFDCIFTDIDTTGAPMTTTKAGALLPPPTRGSSMGSSDGLIKVWGDNGEYLNTRFDNCVFYGGASYNAYIITDGSEGEAAYLNNCLNSYAGYAAYYVGGIHAGNCTFTGTDQKAGYDKCNFILNPQAGGHGIYMAVSSTGRYGYWNLNVSKTIIASDTSLTVRGISAGGATNLTLTDSMIKVPNYGIVVGSYNGATVQRVTIQNATNPIYVGGGNGTFNILDSIIYSSGASLITNAATSTNLFVNKCGLYNVAPPTAGFFAFNTVQRADPIFAQNSSATDTTFLNVLANQYAAIGGGGSIYVGSTTAGYPVVPIDRILKAINANGRNTFGGATVTVVGVAAQGANLDPTRLSRYVIDTTTGFGILADQTGGAATNPAFNSGDIVQMTGTVLEYNGLCEFTPLTGTTSLNLGTSGYTFSTTTVTAAQLNVYDQYRFVGGEYYEGRFISLSNMTVLSEVTVASGSDANISVTDPSNDTTVIRIDKDTLADEYLSTLNGGIITAGSTIGQVRGITTQYDSSDPRSSGYQILPFEQGDFLNVVIFVPVKDWMLY
jgi:hypothetical protein